MKDIFKINDTIAKKVFSAALEKGGDYADLFFENTKTESLSLRDGEVNAISSEIDFGVGIRVLSGEKTGYAFVENNNEKDMISAAKLAARIANGQAKSFDVKFQNLLTNKSLKSGGYYSIVKPWEEFGVKEKIPFLQKINSLVFEGDKRVRKVMVNLNNTVSDILFINSKGEKKSDVRPMVSLSVGCLMEENGVKESGRASRAYRMGAEFLTQDIIRTLAEEVIQKTAILFNAIKPNGGEMPVVFGAGGSGIFLHEAIGHAFEADFNRKGTSIFSDKLHKKVCGDFINVVDDATILNNRGSVNFDDEGIEGKKTYIVKDGILSSYLHDRISAKYYGVNPTGNGRRESFRFAPIPRMRATYMENGINTEQDLISSVKKGVFVDDFTNGQVQIGAGDFTFFVKSGYLIENGRKTEAIRDINIIGNGPKALSDVVSVANNGKIDNGTWMCGKDGQSCPVTCGMPSVLIKKLTVGGLGE